MIQLDSDETDILTWTVPSKEKGKANSWLYRLMGATFNLVLQKPHENNENKGKNVSLAKKGVFFFLCQPLWPFLKPIYS